MSAAADPGTVYIIHLDLPYRHVRPYTPGTATDLQARSGRSYRDPRFAARRRTLQDTPASRDKRHE
jgi:hypothetical protein